MPDDLRGMMKPGVPCSLMRHIAWTCLALVAIASTANAQDGELPHIDAIVASEDADGTYWNVTAEELAAYPAVARAVAQPDFITTLEEGELESTHAFFDQVMERDVQGIRLDGKTYSVGITLAHALPPPSQQSDSAGEDSPGPAALAVLAGVAAAALLRRRR